MTTELPLGGLGGDLSGGRLIGFSPAVVAKLVFSREIRHDVAEECVLRLAWIRGFWSPET